VLQCVAVRGNVLRCVAVCCNDIIGRWLRRVYIHTHVLQCVAVRGNDEVREDGNERMYTQVCVSVCCSVLR